MTVRLLPHETPEREAVLLDRFALVRRERSLVEHADSVEAVGGDASHVRAELYRTRAEMAAVNELLNQP